MNFEKYGNLIKSFLQFNYPQRIQLESYDYFVKYSLNKIFSLNNRILFSNDTFSLKIVSFKLSTPKIETIECNGKNIINTPKLALSTQTSYVSELIVDVMLIKNDGEEEKVFSVSFGFIPVMVGYSIERLSIDEMEKTSGGYFIIKGGKKIVNCEERISYNYPFLLLKKKNSSLTCTWNLKVLIQCISLLLLILVQEYWINKMY